MGINTVAIYSDVDKNALHTRYADESYHVGPSPSLKSYLNADKIIEISKESGAEAIHPGYGFLAENPAFVQACDENKITFIGPNTRSINVMGYKIEARAFVKNLGVPLTEGITGDPVTLIREATSIPFPLLVKAAAGGGGKGMRIVRSENELREAVEATSREAKSYFGDETVYVEKYVENPRDIEIQVLGDNYGNAIH